MGSVGGRCGETFLGVGETEGSGDEAAYGRGTIIASRYRLDTQIGEGGMSTVWRAVDLATSTQVAIKLALPDDPSEDTAVRMQAEARLEAELMHPGVLRSFGCGRTQRGHTFLVLELLEGRTVRELLQERGPLPAVYAVRMLLPIAETLCFVHERAVIHCDLKPDNVFIADEHGMPRPKLLDFGIAKTPVSDTRTADGSVVGSPGYMAPEQACGLTDLDQRVDVWGFCALLREAIGGDPASFDPNACTRRNGEPADDRERAPASAFDAYPELWTVLQRGLAFDRDLRFASMRELTRALTEWLLEQGATDDVCGPGHRARPPTPGSWVVITDLSMPSTSRTCSTGVGSRVSSHASEHAARARARPSLPSSSMWMTSSPSTTRWVT